MSDDKMVNWDIDNNIPASDPRSPWNPNRTMYNTEREEERWVAINGFSKYEISSWGAVRVRLKTGVTKPHRIQTRETGPRASGRTHVTLWTGTGNVERYIDDLVKEHFG